MRFALKHQTYSYTITAAEQLVLHHCHAMLDGRAQLDNWLHVESGDKGEVASSGAARVGETCGVDDSWLFQLPTVRGRLKYLIGIQQ